MALHEHADQRGQEPGRGSRRFRSGAEELVDSSPGKAMLGKNPAEELHRPGVGWEFWPFVQPLHAEHFLPELLHPLFFKQCVFHHAAHDPEFVIVGNNIMSSMIT